MSLSLETVDCGTNPGRLPYGTTTNFQQQRIEPLSVSAAFSGFSDERAAENRPSVSANQAELLERNQRYYSAGFPTNIIADVDDEMRSFERRLESFEHWAVDSPVKAIDLAKAGFYYTGIGDQVRCFSCDLPLMKWEKGDDPLAEHKKCKPTCRFLLECERDRGCYVYQEPQVQTELPHKVPTRYVSEPCRNKENTAGLRNISIPALPIGAVPEVSQHLHRLQSLAQSSQVQSGQAMYTSGSHQGAVYQINPYQSINIQSGTRRDPYIFVRSEEDMLTLHQEESYHGDEQGRMTMPYQTTAQYTSQVPSGASQLYQYMQYPPGQPYYQEMSQRSIPGGATMGMQQRNMEQGAQPPPSREPTVMAPSISPKLPAATYRPQDAPVSRPNQSFTGSSLNQTGRRPHVPYLRIPVVRPLSEQPQGPLVRPEDVHHVTSPTDLENEHHRLTTFVDWPEKAPVRPWELSSAGFYYLGDKDSVKCYKCGVALRNWEPQDTPWEEHEKWSPTCPLVIEYFRTRPQMRPPTGDVPRMGGIPQVPQEREVLYAGNNRYSGEGATVEQSSPCMHPPSMRIEPAENWPASSNYHVSATSPTPFGHPPSSWHPIPGENTELPERPPGEQDIASISCIPQVGNQGISAEDVNKALAMGYSRKDIEAAFMAKILNSGSNFVSFEQLMHALIEGNERREDIGGSSERETPNMETQPSNSHSQPQRQITTGNLSLPSVTERQILRRTQSAPSSSTEMPQDDESLQQKLERMQEERLCKICMDAEVGIVFLPCGHLSCCPDCSKGMELCPMCRSPIRETIRTFLS